MNTVSAELLQDSLAEWSKAPDSSSGGAIRVGSNPTAVILKPRVPKAFNVLFGVHTMLACVGLRYCDIATLISSQT